MFAKLTDFLYSKARDWVIATEMDIDIPLDTQLKDLDLNEYTQEAFDRLKIMTVRDAMFYRCFDLPTPGVGEKSWENLMDAIYNDLDD